MLWRMLPSCIPEAGKAQDGYFKDRFIFQTPEEDAKVDGRCNDVRRSGVNVIKKSSLSLTLQQNMLVFVAAKFFSGLADSCE
jgi:hypothetical protein